MGESRFTEILIVEAPNGRPLPPSEVLKSATNDGRMQVASSVSTAKSLISRLSAPAILVINEPIIEIFQGFRQKFPHGKIILVTDLTMEKYSAVLGGLEESLLDHVIANRTPSTFTSQELRITLQKLIRDDLFGIEKYLSSNTPIHSLRVTASSDRDRINQSIETFALQNGLSHQFSKLAHGISEELLMNVIYDAPTRDGVHPYAELHRSVPVTLRPEEQSTISFGMDHNCFAIAATDPFGGLTRPKLFQYLRKVLQREEGADLVDKKAGGAGLGLYKILYSSHSLVCNVKPNVRTDVIALIDINYQIRDFSKQARSIHYFQSP